MPWTFWRLSRALPPRASPAATSSGIHWWHALSMPTKRRATMSPDLSLVVQYATPAPDLPRWRLRRWVRQAVIAVAGQTPGRFRAAGFTLRLVDADEGRRLNHEFRQKDYATNVLTFEYGVDRDGVASGDIVLCVPGMQREAAEQG